MTLSDVQQLRSRWLRTQKLLLKLRRSIVCVLRERCHMRRLNICRHYICTIRCIACSRTRICHIQCSTIVNCTKSIGLVIVGNWHYSSVVNNEGGLAGQSPWVAKNQKTAGVDMGATWAMYISGIDSDYTIDITALSIKLSTKDTSWEETVLILIALSVL